jgi:hypothetical protein
MSMFRREFLKGLLVAPAAIIPVKSGAAKPHHRFQAGDQVGYRNACPANRDRNFCGGRIVSHVSEDNHTVYVRNGYYGRHSATEPFDASELKLHEGLPGNRVNNPSMRHCLIETPGHLGLRYPEDPISA